MTGADGPQVADRDAGRGHSARAQHRMRHSQGTRSDEFRPMICPWPLPPLRPKRAASGVAGLRYGSGQDKTNHALMSETSGGQTSA